MEAISFRALHTFHRYEELVTKIDPAHSNAKLLKLMIQKSLCEDLVSSEDQLSPCIDDVKFLLRSSVGYDLASENCLRSVKRFCTRVMKQPTTLDVKLGFLGDLYQKFVCAGWADDSKDFEKHIQDSIRDAMVASGSTSDSALSW